MKGRGQKGGERSPWDVTSEAKKNSNKKNKQNKNNNNNNNKKNNNHNEQSKKSPRIKFALASGAVDVESPRIKNVDPDMAVERTTTH